MGCGLLEEEHTVDDYILFLTGLVHLLLPGGRLWLPAFHHIASQWHHLTGSCFIYFCNPFLKLTPSLLFFPCPQIIDYA